MILKDVIDSAARQTGAIVNVDLRHPRVWDIGDLQIRPHQAYHHGAYCQFRKLRGKNPACAKNKMRSFEIAERGRPFWGTCPFGVWDFAKPVFYSESLLGVVYLGGYSDGNPLADVHGEEYDGERLESVTADKRRQLSLYAEFIAEFIRFACQQWVDGGNRWDIERSTSFYEDACRNFIESRYTEPVRLQDLAETLGMTANHLGVVIKEQFGKSFRRLLEDHRIERARVSLKAETWKPITQIAYECGFSDSNYFSTVFKKVVGVNPRAYREDTPSNL